MLMLQTGILWEKMWYDMHQSGQHVPDKGLRVKTILSSSRNKTKL